MKTVSICFFLLLVIFDVLAVPPTPKDWTGAVAKAKQLVSTLTLEEKVSLATGVGWEGGPCLGNTPAITRVGFPGYCLHDSPTGVRYSDFASAFPTSMNVASTWDRKLMRAVGTAIGEEFRGKGVNIALTPMMNMGRVAAGGRNWEGFGAEPYLTAEAASQEIQGIQSAGVIACAKHYIGNEQEHYRTTSSSNIDDKTMHELYGYPFMYSVLAGVGSVMCSYNLINNTYACENEKTLINLLKKEYSYQGFVMSDWGATMSGVKSVLAGLDMTMPGDIAFGSKTSYFGKNLTQAVNNGSVPLSRLDDMGVRIVAPWYLMGQDKNYPPVAVNFVNRTQVKKVYVNDDHYRLIREVGSASTVLLKNTNNILPFSSEPKGNGLVTFALIGSDAGPPTRGRGPNSCADHGCTDGTLAQGWGSGTTDFPYLVTPVEAFQRMSSERHFTLTYTFNDWNTQNAAQTAALADVAIVFSNADSGEEYITFDTNMGDRNNLSLWNNGDKLIEAVANANPNTIVVIHSVGPVLMPWINHQNIKAVVWAGLPGQETGNALADVLFGVVNPSGRLIYTIAKQRSDYSADVLYKSTDKVPQIPYSEGLLIDHHWFDFKNIEPQFPFGFGLSYTTFSYSRLVIQASNETGIKYRIQVSITNTGRLAGHEVAQLYLGFPAGAGEPPKLLRGFERVYLKAGEAADVVFLLANVEISVWDVSKQNWGVYPGQYQVHVGSSSRDIKLTGSFTV